MPLPDQPARDAILTDLDANLVVEAAAGTGKTTCLVGRLVALCARGALAGDARLAAVTFTLKAAAELRDRLARRLAAELADPALPADQRRNLEAAAANLPDCHIGTIHSFCARILRERPVEAGVSPDFRELEEDDDALLRRRAWDEFTRDLHGPHCREMRTAFEIFGLDADTLGDGFLRYADYPDMDDWPGDDAGLERIDVAGFMDGVRAFHAGLDHLRPLLCDADCGTDKLLPILRLLDRRWPRLPTTPTLTAAFGLAGMLKKVDAPVQKWWKQFGLTGAEAKEQVEAYAAFRETVVKPFRDACLAAVYAQALAAYRRAADIYDRLRREAGVLNFQDLLMTAARLVRDFPEVRADLAGRYARLLVDEVQDTDPVQAELMFLLAADDPRQRDWRRCRPRPGALFIVGDPKQSIYRFRRADIVVYQTIKNRIVETGGRVLGLTANFRSQPDVLDWVNRTYRYQDGLARSPEATALGGRFGDGECDYSPAYVPLSPGRGPAADGCFHGVYSLETIAKKKGTSEDDIVQDEAARIAAFIRHAVDTGMPIPDGDSARPARPGDFLIVTYRKAKGAAYAAALRQMGLDVHLSSGGTLASSPELALLTDYLDALAQPDDPIRLLAVLRGGLFGIPDDALYAWKQAGRAFDFLAPAGAPPDAPLAAVADAMAALRRHHAALRATLPAQALDGLAADLGLWATAAMAPDGPRRAGALATAIDLLKADGPAVATTGAMAERLRWYRDKYEDEPLSAAPSSGEAVRVMNLHKTKGLEAPVVFLTSTRTARRQAAGFAVRRDGGRTQGGLCLRQGEHGAIEIARPAAWDTLAAGEELFLAAERTRLNYVAATRAGAALVVSVHKTSKGWHSAFLPEYVPGVTIEQALPEPPPEWRAARLEEAASRSAGAVDAALLDAADAARQAARTGMLRPSYAVERAKPERPRGDGGLFSRLDDAAAAPWEAEAARDRGEAAHRLMESTAAGAALRDEAARLLRDLGLPAAEAPAMAAMVESARASAIWRRADAAAVRYREAPFSVREDDGVLRRGVIDLVFKEEDGWVIVDYKTDAAADDPGRHAAQLDHYRAAWERLTGEAVKETGVYYLRFDEYVVLKK